jgi:hypothetical protein
MHFCTVQLSAVYTDRTVWLYPDLVGINRCRTLNPGFSRSSSRCSTETHSSLASRNPDHSCVYPTERSLIEVLHHHVRLCRYRGPVQVSVRRKDPLVTVQLGQRVRSPSRHHKLLQHARRRQELLGLAQNLRKATHSVRSLSFRWCSGYMTAAAPNLAPLLLGCEEPLDELLPLEHNRVREREGEGLLAATISVGARLGPEVAIQLQWLLPERVLARNALAFGPLASSCCHS